MADYIKREDILARFVPPEGVIVPMLNVSVESIASLINSIPSADVRHVVTCDRCRYNNHCLTQEFVEDNSVVPFNSDVFFCSDGEEIKEDD